MVGPWVGIEERCAVGSGLGAVLRTTVFVVFGASSACGAAVPLPPRAIELNAAGVRAVAEGRLAVAEARLSVALEYSPRFVEAWVNLGYVELARGNFEQARRDFLRARDINPDMPTPHPASSAPGSAAPTLLRGGSTRA